MKLDPAYPRLYQNYSGDISGRYIEALSILRAPGQARELDAIVQQGVQCQRADGRFGDPSLVFEVDQIGPSHMALLWGNGRLLVGLTTY